MRYVLMEFLRYTILMAIEFAQIISTLDQRPETTEPVPVFMDQNDAISGIEHSSDHPADIRIVESGTYVVIAAPQIGRLSGDTPGFIDFWLRKNNKDIPNSNVRASITTNEDKDVIVIIGLLCPKPSGRKIAMVGAVAGMVSYAIFFAIPGIVAFGILLWYLSRTHTKEYFSHKK